MVTFGEVWTNENAERTRCSAASGEGTMLCRLRRGHDALPPSTWLLLDSSLHTSPAFCFTHREERRTSLDCCVHCAQEHEVLVERPEATRNLLDVGMNIYLLTGIVSKVGGLTVVGSA